MKLLLITLLLTSISINVFAKCADSGLSFFPEKKTITENSWFMIEAYASSQKIIQQLNQDYPIYLQGKKQKIRLIAVNKHQGMFDLTQVILKPEKTLTLGETYYLKIDNLNQFQKNEIYRWNYSNNEREGISWLVKKKKDNIAPKWITKPKFKKTRCEFYGCGPEYYAIFDCKIKDESEYLVKTEFNNPQTKKTIVYYLTVTNNKIKVGHGMCAGAFAFGDIKKNKQFKVRFALMDASGNESSKYTKAIKFKHPYKEPK